MSPHVSDEQLYRYVDRDLNRHQQAEVEKHVESCPACQARLAEVQFAEQAFRMMARPRVPTDFTARVMADIEARRNALWNRRLVRGSLHLVMAVGLGMLVLFATEIWALGDAALVSLASNREVASVSDFGGTVFTWAAAETALPLSLALLALGLFGYAIGNLTRWNGVSEFFRPDGNGR